jgi:hypothetical protein
MTDMYLRYLKETFNKASAAWRREMRKNPRPCSICGDFNAEVMPEGNWLCREHKAQWKAMVPFKSYATRLNEMGIKFLSEEDHAAGVRPPKKKRKLPDVKVQGVKQWQMSIGGSAKKTPVKRATKKK